MGETGDWVLGSVKNQPSPGLLSGTFLKERHKLSQLSHSGLGFSLPSPNLENHAPREPVAGGAFWNPPSIHLSLGSPKPAFSAPLVPRSPGASHLHLLAVGKVARRDVVLQLDLGEDDGQLEDQLLLLVLLPKHGGHLLLQVADDVRVDLREEVLA